MDDIDSLRLALEAEKHNHRKDNEYLIGVIRGLMEIAEMAMPDTYFATDSRVAAARELLPNE